MAPGESGRHGAIVLGRLVQKARGTGPGIATLSMEARTVLAHTWSGWTVLLTIQIVVSGAPLL